MDLIISTRHLQGRQRGVEGVDEGIGLGAFGFHAGSQRRRRIHLKPEACVIRPVAIRAGLSIKAFAKLKS